MFLGDTNEEVGPIAHLVERIICNDEVSGSSPLGSTKNRVMWMTRKRKSARENKTFKWIYHFGGVS